MQRLNIKSKIIEVSPVRIIQLLEDSIKVDILRDRLRRVFLKKGEELLERLSKLFNEASILTIVLFNLSFISVLEFKDF